MKDQLDKFFEEEYEASSMEPDYTIIKDNRIRTKICELMSEMFDNPDKYGIYPTSKFMSKMEDFVLEERSKHGTA